MGRALVAIQRFERLKVRFHVSAIYIMARWTANDCESQKRFRGMESQMSLPLSALDVDMRDKSPGNHKESTSARGAVAQTKGAFRQRFRQSPC
jgi:hypothetical protein